MVCARPNQLHGVSRDNTMVQNVANDLKNKIINRTLAVYRSLPLKSVRAINAWPA